MTNSKIVEYQIVIANLHYELEREVNEYIGSGWQPFGAITFYKTGDFMVYLQPMIKYS